MTKRLLDEESKNLINWFNKSKRDLPWRKNRTPYRVWISELMLQQTRVNQVIPYYNKWMKNFPSLTKLSSASEQDILKLWEGLGYYSRARNIHKSSQIIKDKYQNKFPKNPSEIELLPGIGSYTKAAICSLAYNLDYAVLDGNVIRVLSRFFLYDKDILKNSSKKHLQEIIDSSLPEGKAGEFNEAMMELGSQICTPKSPKCNICPIENKCLAKKTNQQSQYPIKNIKKNIPHIIVGAAVIIDSKNRILVSQRSNKKMLGGLWEFPGGKKELNETIEQCIIREIKEEVGLKIEIKNFLTCINHSYSHFSMEMHTYYAKIINGFPKGLEGQKIKWLKKNRLRELPYSIADLKVIDAIESDV